MTAANGWKNLGERRPVAGYFQDMAFSVSIRVVIVSRAEQPFNVLVNGTCEMLFKRKDEEQIFECSMGGSVVYKIEITPFIGEKACVQIPKRYRGPLLIEVFDTDKGIRVKVE